MTILMLGWEFPPKISGGLGVASQGLSEAMAKAGHKVTFLLPKKTKNQVSKLVKLVDASALTPDLDYWKDKKTYEQIIKDVEMGERVLPYLPAQSFQNIKETKIRKVVLEPTEESELLERIRLTGEYEGQLNDELIKYAMLAVQVAIKEKPKMIHAHDWITFRAGRMIKSLLKKKLCLHVHSTEYDRNGSYAQPFILEEEQLGFEACDHIFCVSEKLKNTIVSHYGIAAKKITVAPNALTLSAPEHPIKRPPVNIAFVGRLTPQKSPATFLDIARELTSLGYDFHYFIMGDGYLRSELEENVKTSNFSDRVTFTGFLERTRLLQKLNEMDLLVMPSASEPFGLVALEAIMKKIPVAAAKGSGVGEFIPSMPQVDRWDHYSYNKLIVRLMTDDSYRREITESCLREASKLTWENTVRRIEKVYQKT
ncbi:MAG: glycosyltransferase family 4 protein [Marinoscillum sp.]|uniref:glycosyltransferase family 4 protein n=1 Tax=Marinoscillum sp. TaxID=2024838 RepID=UPI00330423BA